MVVPARAILADVPMDAPLCTEVTVKYAYEAREDETSVTVNPIALADKAVYVLKTSRGGTNNVEDDAAVPGWPTALYAVTVY